LSSQKIGEYSDTIRIRAHHLLCIQGFQGKGYSADFINNMNQIIYFLNDGISKKIRVINHDDDICTHCPHLEKTHLEKNICSQFPESEKRIKKMDDLTIKLLKLECGQKYNYKYIFSRINEIISFYQIKNICGHCSWNKDCLFYLKFI
jgi:hypothetical protein